MRLKRGLFESPRVPWLCMLLLLGPPAMARADALTDKARTLTSKVSHVTVFKNGTGFFIRTAQPTSAGWLVMDPPPRALQGSFWIQRGYDALIDRLRLKEGKRWESATCGSWGPLLAVNPGKKVRLELHSKAIVEGRLVPITGYDSLKGKRAGLPDFVLLDTGRGISMVPRAQIRLVHFAGKPTQTCKAVKRVPRLYLHLKTEGALQERIAKLRWPLFGAFLVAYLGVTIATLVLVPHATTNFDRFPVAWVVVVLNVLAVANVPRAIHHGKPGQAFLSSCALIAALVFLFGMAMFPKLALSSLDPAYDLDAWNAASSESTLGLMRWIALLGMPFVLTYTAIVYWVFRGKTKLDDFSY